jgi:mannose-1-phosphate guanylyltransferase
MRRLTGTNDDGNSTHGKHLTIDTRNCVVRSSGDHLLVTLGIEDCIVVHTDDATLVASLQDESAIRKVVDELESRGMDAWL